MTVDLPKAKQLLAQANPDLRLDPIVAGQAVSATAVVQGEGFWLGVVAFDGIRKGWKAVQTAPAEDRPPPDTIYGSAWEAAYGLLVFTRPTLDKLMRYSSRWGQPRAARIIRKLSKAH